MMLGTRRPRQQGLVALLLAATLLLTLSTTLVLSELGQRREVGDQQALTQKRLLALRQVLVNFASVNGRLPCPADGSLRPGDVNLGLERRAADGTCLVVAGPPITPIMNRGVVPWVTLGLTETDALDGWNTRISYRTITALAAPPNLGFTSNRALDATGCDPGGAAARAAVTVGGNR